MMWITVVEWLARLILVILIGLSIWSISIIIERKRYFSDRKLPLDEFKKSLKSFMTTEQIEKAFEVFLYNQRSELEKGLAVLGTLGSTTPFIGLLGTILGIIVSFGELSRGAGSTNEVMFSLAEALILTAVGLVVAIPAVIAFNFYSRKAKALILEANAAKDNFIAYKE
jgi:biopolymer transport protein ExbB/TolQ